MNIIPSDVRQVFTSKQYNIKNYQMNRMGCGVCERRIGKGFKRLKRKHTCDTWRDFPSIKCWKRYREHQYRIAS